MNPLETATLSHCSTSRNIAFSLFLEFQTMYKVRKTCSANCNSLRSDPLRND